MAIAFNSSIGQMETGRALGLAGQTAYSVNPWSQGETMFKNSRWTASEGHQRLSSDFHSYLHTDAYIPTHIVKRALPPHTEEKECSILVHISYWRDVRT